MKQQIVISGFGGQGVIFLTRLIAETALIKGLSILGSETHGMAQRGGNVVSHIKIYEENNREKFWSPLIRPESADLMIALHPESILPYRHLIRKDGVVICNGSTTAEESPSVAGSVILFDANKVASELGDYRMTNLILLGFAASKGYLFCSLNELTRAAETFNNRAFIEALKAGA